MFQKQKMVLIGWLKLIRDIPENAFLIHDANNMISKIIQRKKDETEKDYYERIDPALRGWTIVKTLYTSEVMLGINLLGIFIISALLIINLFI